MLGLVQAVSVLGNEFEGTYRWSMCAGHTNPSRRQDSGWHVSCYPRCYRCHACLHAIHDSHLHLTPQGLHSCCHIPCRLSNRALFVPASAESLLHTRCAGDLVCR